MKQQELREKLRARRDRLEYSQEYMGAKLGISQAAYSDIETGKTKLTEKLVTQIKAIDKFEDFFQEEPDKDLKSFGQTIVEKWPWKKKSLYLIIAIIGWAGLDVVVRAPADFMRGSGAGTEQQYDVITGMIGLGLTLMLALFIYWFFWVKKW